MKSSKQNGGRRKTHYNKTRSIRRKRSKTRRSKTRRSKTRRSKTQRRKTRGGADDFTTVQCAPKDSNDNELQNFSCYTKDALKKMRSLWNARHKDLPIETTDPREIWQKLREKMKDACHSEACWLKQKFMENNLNNELTDFTFAPKSPQKWKENHNTWLNSNDIEKVMKQYEHTYKCFRFIGPTPIDFDKHVYENKCVWDDLCHFDLAKMVNEGVTKIGIIFNTDPHNKSGAHWISLFINIKKGFVFFFDSNGTKIPKEITEFSNRVISQGLQLKTTKYPDGVRLTFDQNAPFAHQEGNTECGMYSLYFIVTLLKSDKDKPYEFFKTTKISDASMEKMRDKYFNPKM
jgi:hypothetical protein